ncbi:uncharacterized protein be [Halyomorpha halys]|uniref:uncharacterized protein be n=1 Tax=Halyomorpha halys TaxID=286706 RepID=UPI0006D4CEA3|nr:uncharacterized protein LOC106688081 [Halyomorpha halys]
MVSSLRCQVFALLSLLTLLGGAGSAGGVAPQYNSNLCDFPACACPRSYSKIVCTCDQKIQEITLQATGFDYLPNTLGSIEINRCATVVVTRRSIKNITPLRRIALTNIGQLQLDEEAFYWDTTQNLDSYIHPGIDIVIANSSIPTLPSEVFKGHINSITLQRVHISLIKALAFANIARMEKIEISNSNIDTIVPQAFKKFILNTFIVEGGRIGSMPTYSMNAVQVMNDIKFENVNFGIIQSSALKITEPKVFRLRSCTISQLEGEAFHITTKGPIFIDDNIFHYTARGAFLRINLDPRSIYTSGIQELVFENNTLDKFEEYALFFNTSGIKPRIDQIIINRPCACTELNAWSTKLVKFSTDQTPKNFDKLMRCLKGKQDVTLLEYQLKNCTSNTSRVYLIVTILIVILISLLCICSVGFWLFRKHAKRYMNVPTNDGNNRLSVLSSTSNHIIVLPERKIYRETELNVMTECVEPIKEYVPPQAITQPL